MKKLYTIGLIAASSAIIYSIYKAGQVVETVADVAEEINPLDSNNIFNRGLSEVINNSTGGENKNLGELWHSKCAAQGYEPWYCPSVNNG